MTTEYEGAPHDPWTRWFAGVAAILLAVLLALVVVAGLRGPSTSERLDNVENQLQLMTCLLLLPAEDRVARGLAECQIQPEGTP